MEEVLQLKINGQFGGRDATLSINFEAEEAFEITNVEAGEAKAEGDESVEGTVADEQMTKAPTEPEEASTPEATGEVEEPETAQADVEADETAEETQPEPVSSVEPETPETTTEAEETTQTTEGDASVSASHPMRAEPVPDDEANEEPEEEKDYDTDIPSEVADEVSEQDNEEPGDNADSTEDTGSDEEPPEVEYDEDELPTLNADTKQFSVAKQVADADDEWVRVRAITDKLKEEEGESEWNDSKATSHLYSVMDKGIVERKKDENSGKYVYHLTNLGRATINQSLKDADLWDAEAKAAT